MVMTLYPGPLQPKAYSTKPIKPQTRIATYCLVGNEGMDAFIVAPIVKWCLFNLIIRVLKQVPLTDIAYLTLLWLPRKTRFQANPL